MNNTAPFKPKIGHAHLKVRDLKRAIDFYSQVLGLELTETVGEHYAFLTDGTMHHAVALQSVGTDAPMPSRNSVGLYHIAFEVPDKASFARALAHIRQAGIGVSSVDHLISWAMYFTDPDGNGLEIYVDTRDTPNGQPLWTGMNIPISEQELHDVIGLN